MIKLNENIFDLIKNIIKLDSEWNYYVISSLFTNIVKWKVIKINNDYEIYDDDFLILCDDTNWDITIKLNNLSWKIINIKKINDSNNKIIIDWNWWKIDWQDYIYLYNQNESYTICSDWENYYII